MSSAVVPARRAPVRRVNTATSRLGPLVHLVKARKEKMRRCVRRLVAIASAQKDDNTTMNLVRTSVVRGFVRNINEEESRMGPSMRFTSGARHATCIMVQTLIHKLLQPAAVLQGLTRSVQLTPEQVEAAAQLTQFPAYTAPPTMRTRDAIAYARALIKTKKAQAAAADAASA
jgi:hypothetical protein